MSAESLGLPPDFGGEVRLFPLPHLVMFPGNVLPLHISESRYREMLEDAVQSDQLTTMATLLPGFEHEYYSRPAIAPVVCIGQVTAHEKTERGTYNLTLAGLQRARIKHEIEPVRSFRRARVELIDDRSSQPDDAGKRLGQQLADRVLQTLPTAQELVAGLIQRKISLASFTDIVAFHLPLAMEAKLRLLAEADALIRAKLLLDNLPAATVMGRGNRRYPADFSNN